MQRMGGGSRKRGGGNDPRCGCDMRVGWESSFGDMKQQGGSCNGSCSVAMVPQMGGGCGCGLFKGGKTRKARKGGAQDLNPAPVKLPGFGVTLSNTRANVSSIANYAGKGGAQDLSPAPVHFKGFGVTISDEKGQYMGKGGAADCDFGCPFKGTGYCNFYAKGGANYGEPMPLQAKLRGGGVNGCGCLTKPFFRGGSVLINRMEDVIIEMNRFLQKYPALQAGAVVTRERINQMNEEKDRIWEMFDEVSYNINGPLTNAEDTKKVQLLNADDKMKERIEMYATAAQVGGYRPTKKNLKYLRRYKQGKSIGFTMKASLKAKGLIPRTSKKYKGKKVLGNKYK